MATGEGSAEMRLGYITTEGRGAADRCLAGLAEDLAARGHRVAGAVQINRETRADRRCDMILRLLPSGRELRISQALGAGARGCRLDPGGLEAAVAGVAAALETGPEALILNKFGKQEAEGRGFRPLIGEAVSRGVPVLLAVNLSSLPAFEVFAEGMAERLPCDRAALARWLQKG
ncbi:MAG: DUF2478 domain-containing protein [Paracoccaceae bacterium]